MAKRLAEMEQLLPAAERQKALEERLTRIEKTADKVPELPPNVVSAGDFPGSLRIPGTDAAVKFGGRIRTAVVFTLDPLGSDDRFVTNSIPVEDTDAAAGQGRRTVFTANTSRFNFEMRTPTGVGQVRTFIEGDFVGREGRGRASFRLPRLRPAPRVSPGPDVVHLLGSSRGPPPDMDYEDQRRERHPPGPDSYTISSREQERRDAAAIETPGVDRRPGRERRAGHGRARVLVLGDRPFRLRSSSEDLAASPIPAHGIGLGERPGRASRVVPSVTPARRSIHLPAHHRPGNARTSTTPTRWRQDAVFDPAGELHPLKATGFYLDYEHQWKEWERARKMKLRSSLIWSFVTVDNLDFQLPTAYHKTNRYSVNLVFSPLDRIDLGVEYIYGTRENKDGHRGDADQVQAVGIFRF
jgi:hypothetical protein